MKLDQTKRRRGQRAVMTADGYRELIQALVDKARADHSIAARLAEEARPRFGPEIEAARETG